MKNKVSEIQSISTKRDNSKAQISRYLLDNKNELPQEIVLLLLTAITKSY